MKAHILITLPTGKTGYETARQLLQQGTAVRIMARKPSIRTTALERLGAELVIGGFHQYEAWSRALKGIRTVYYCYPIMPGMQEDVRLFLQAAHAQGVQDIVFMGQWLAEFEDQISLQTKSIQAAYALLEQSGIPVVYLIPGYFVENNIGVLAEFAVQLGILPSPYGQGKNPLVSNEDLAACIAALLQDPAPYRGRRLRPTGPASLSIDDMAKTIQKITGRRVLVVPIPPWMFLKAAFSMKDEWGYDDFIISQGYLYNAQYRQNKFDIGGPTDVVRTLTGKAPEDFETIMRRLIDQSSYGMPNATGWWRAMAKCMKIPFQPIPSAKTLAALNTLSQPIQSPHLKPSKVLYTPELRG